jgi:hypothetical protein
VGRDQGQYEQGRHVPAMGPRPEEREREPREEERDEMPEPETGHDSRIDGALLGGGGCRDHEGSPAGACREPATRLCVVPCSGDRVLSARMSAPGGGNRLSARSTDRSISIGARSNAVSLAAIASAAVGALGGEPTLTVSGGALPRPPGCRFRRERRRGTPASETWSP